MKKLIVILIVMLHWLAATYSSSIFGPETRLLNNKGLHIESNVGYEPISESYLNGSWRDTSITEIYNLTKLYFGLGKEFTIGGEVYYKQITPEENGSIEAVSGLGDTEARFIYRPVSKADVEGDEGTILLGGVRTPTGNTDKVPTLGDGSWDFMVGVGSSKKVSIFYGQAVLGMWINGEDHNGKSLDNEFFFNFTVDFKATREKDSSQVLSVIAELNGGFFGSSFGDKSSIELSLGPQWYVTDNFVLQAAAAVPVSVKEMEYKYPFSVYGGFFLNFE